MTSSRNCFHQRRDNAVAEAETTTPETITPSLYDVVDPDALDALFDSRAAATATTPATCGSTTACTKSPSPTTDS